MIKVSNILFASKHCNLSELLSPNVVAPLVVIYTNLVLAIQYSYEQNNLLPSIFSTHLMPFKPSIYISTIQLSAQRSARGL